MRRDNGVKAVKIINIVKLNNMNFNIFKRKPIKMGRRRREAVEQYEPFEHYTTKRQNDFAVGGAIVS